MKFNEKLIELRKKQGLSQEELGYKINVTRQTVSKWELGQTTPEMDKLVEISKAFNISVDELINESEVTTNNNPMIEDQPIQNEKSKNNKVLILIVGLLIVVIVAIVGSVISSFKKVSVEDEAKGFLGKIFSLFDKAIDSQLSDEENLTENMGEDVENIFGNIFGEASNKINTGNFNGALELYNGSNSGTQLKNLLEKVITSNKKEDRKITVKYLETETQDTEEIKNLKMSLKDSNNFEVTFDYDGEGYINNLTIEKVVDEFEVRSFNNGLEIFAGSSNGMTVTNILDKIITSNKTEDRKITVKYKGTETQNETEIRNIKKNFGTFDNCEITYEYDVDGFINKAIIEKL